MTTDFRGTGRTTIQMQNAPVGAIFVWSNELLNYPKYLAARVNRLDLQIKPRSWFCHESVVGRSDINCIVLDHHMEITDGSNELRVVQHLISHGIPVGYLPVQRLTVSC